MSKNKSRNVTLAGLTLGAVAIGAFAVVPAFGQSAVRVVNSIVTCASASACVDGRNTSTGQGVKGLSAKGTGVEGQTTFASSGTQFQGGVVGRDLSSTGTGDIGVFGVSTRGVGARGVSTSGTGVLGQSTSSTGVVATSASNNGILSVTGFGGGASAKNSGVAGFDNSTSGTTNFGVFGGSSNGTGVHGNGGFVGVDGVSGYIAVRGGSNGFPLVLTDAGLGNLFYVDGSGNVYYHGSLNHFSATRNNSVATTYVANTTTPTVEDSGTARLINGQATVRLDSAFAQTIDASQPYQVMLTPNGDTRGLFVVTKTPGVFVVRELQGGRSTLGFDYHIYAHAFGHGSERMVVRSASAAAALMPKTKKSANSARTLTHPILPFK